MIETLQAHSFFLIMNSILSTVLTSWHPVRNLGRWLRLAFGLFLAVQAWQLHDVPSGFLSAVLLFQAVTNTGCCGAAGCALPPPVKEKNLSREETVDEEVK